MGPNVKFVLTITDVFSNKKMGVDFFPEKRPSPGGVGSEGGLVKDHTFPLFFEPFPYLERKVKLLKYCGDAPRPTLCQLLHDPTSSPAKFTTINQSQQNKFKNARMKQLFLPVPFFVEQKVGFCSLFCC